MDNKLYNDDIIINTIPDWAKENPPKEPYKEIQQIQQPGAYEEELSKLSNHSIPTKKTSSSCKNISTKNWCFIFLIFTCLLLFAIGVIMLDKHDNTLNGLILVLVGFFMAIFFSWCCWKCYHM